MGNCPFVAADASTQGIAERIGYPPAALVPILEDERRRGHVPWTGRGWQLVPSSFAPETLAALHALDLALAELEGQRPNGPTAGAARYWAQRSTANNGGATFRNSVATVPA
jgi:hypothetical protein